MSEDIRWEVVRSNGHKPRNAPRFQLVRLAYWLGGVMVTLAFCVTAWVLVLHLLFKLAEWLMRII
jgi:hypothetical protein